jgi:hypothetical protein
MMKPSSIMIQSMLWVVLSIEVLGLINYTEILSSLLQNSMLGICGDCAICSGCFNDCPAGIFGLDQQPYTFYANCPDKDPMSQDFWSCLCEQQQEDEVKKSITASLATCRMDGMFGAADNSTYILSEFSSICTNVSLIAAPMTPTSYNFTGRLPFVSSTIHVSYSASTTNAVTSSRGLLGLSKS